MDGDSPELSKMLTVANDYNAWFMLDDAHGIGVNGERGEGSFAKQQQHLNSTHILVITFGKAIGAQGAAVIADKSVIDYLTNFSKEYIYSTHISPVQTQLVLSNITKVQQQQWRRIQLHHNIEYFKSLMAALPFTLLPSDSAIQPILVHNEVLCMTMAEALKQQGFWLGAMRYPTVAKGQARLRLTISASHTEDDIKGLVQALALIGEQYVREA
jgi:8-amino-7-oxononanoate synthase